VPVSVAFASWTARASSTRRRLGASYALALGAVAVIMTARDAFTALFCWETLTLAFYLLAGSERNKQDRPTAAQITFAFGKVSGAALLAGLLLLAARSHSILLASFAHVPGGAPRTTAEVLLVLGFAVKAGLVPFQVWMPRGYAAAPAPARPGPRDHGLGLRQRRLLRHVAHPRPDRPGARLADRRPTGAQRAERATRHRPRRGAEPAVLGDRLRQHREHLLFAGAVSGRRLLRVRRVTAWRSAARRPS